MLEIRLIPSVLLVFIVYVADEPVRSKGLRALLVAILIHPRLRLQDPPHELFVEILGPPLKLSLTKIMILD